MNNSYARMAEVDRVKCAMGGVLYIRYRAFVSGQLTFSSVQSVNDEFADVLYSIYKVLCREHLFHLSLLFGDMMRQAYKIYATKLPQMSNGPAYDPY